jgi:hypothetical protein
LGRHDEAHHCLDKIIADHVRDSNGAEAKRNKGLMLLNRGKFAAGWPLFEYRKGVGPDSRREKEIPRWKGNALNGKLWVWGEQGLGDHILYASMIDDLRARTNSIVVEVEPRLVGLFSRSFPDIEVIPMGESAPQTGIEAQIPIASLGGYLRTDWSSFQKTSERGYFTADPARTLALRSRLSGGNQKIVGISWRSVRRRLGASKSAQLEDFLQILRLPGIRFVDLQYGDTSEDRRRLQSATGISLTRFDDIDNTNDIDGLAALMTACDVIVSVSNTNAHLAGALGRPTWVFAPYGFSQIWYWFPETSKSPWYPRVEVRHQGTNQSWEEVISSTAAEIETFIRSSEGEMS